MQHELEHILTTARDWMDHLSDDFEIANEG
jgi:hypothetical protein